MKYSSNDRTNRRQTQEDDENTEELRPSKVYISSSPGIRSSAQSVKDERLKGKNPLIRGGIVKFRRKLKFTKKEDIEKIILIQAWWRSIYYQKFYKQRVGVQTESNIPGGIVALSSRAEAPLFKLPPHFISKEIKTNYGKPDGHKRDPQDNVEISNIENLGDYYQQKIKPYWDEKNRFAKTYMDLKYIDPLKSYGYDTLNTLEIQGKPYKWKDSEFVGEDFQFNIFPLKNELKPLQVSEVLSFEKVRAKPTRKGRGPSEKQEPEQKEEIKGIKGIEGMEGSDNKEDPSKKKGYEGKQEPKKEEVQEIENYHFSFPNLIRKYYKSKSKVLWEEDNSLSHPFCRITYNDPIKEHSIDTPNNFEYKSTPKKLEIEKQTNDFEILSPDDLETYYHQKLLPYWNKRNKLTKEQENIKVMFDDLEELRAYYVKRLRELPDNLNVENLNKSMELINPDEPDNYYQNKLKPIWAEKNKFHDPHVALSIREPRTENTKEINDEIEIIQPNDAIKYYKSKMLPIWNKQNMEQPEKNVIVNEPNEDNYYENKVKPIWNEKNKFVHFSGKVSFKDQ